MTAPRHESSLSEAEAEGKRGEFYEAMHGDTEKDKTEASGQRTGARDEENEAAMPPPFSGDALLRSLGESYVPLGTQTVATAVTGDASALAVELAERILVNTDNRAEGGEVRVTLKDSLLPDTEIILRQEGDRLIVQLASGNPASLATLRLAQGDLQDKLLALGKDVSVEVTDNTAQEDSSAWSSDARSRGLDYLRESES